MKTKNKAEKSRIQIGIDKELKENAELVLEELGLTPTTAITILYKQVVARGEFPVAIKLSEAEKHAIQLLQLTKNQPVKELVTDSEIEEWLNED
ncbi:type II toxin-antitoxin system RelB/DinJ family antitoxin [Enterococcus sp.]|uniref:type II toxin-antitoxin system RelB/DinJ family antitoxin n=1 Tax=Enterococcus sp. TaxID=35783 RepID=UPI000EB94E70|nr:type II toxin-antitoxin system RelB/DinJ family antitoxin [Enterococcus sp.]HCE11439.1 type II toxin-antitoxin system antitoxin, RelB/DinJ family [Enterococcus sp.]